MVRLPVQANGQHTETLLSAVHGAEVIASSKPGYVCLVGAGPGDPELLTVKAMRRLQAADVVLHDNLISEEILNLVPDSAELINVGKRCGDVKDRGLQQQEIHDLLLIHARSGSMVVRLKCGDPLVFGRGGEELEFLAQHGIEAEVVPGITTALGVAAACQLPLTHRGYECNHVRFLVGQTKARAVPDFEWDELARDVRKQTMVLYMGMKTLDGFCGKLLEHGAPAETPIALVESATNPYQRTLFGTIDSMPEMARQAEAGATAPVVFIIGPTVRFPADLKALLTKSRWAASCESEDNSPTSISAAGELDVRS